MRRAALAVVFALAALAAAAAWGSEPAPASHGGSDPARPGRYPGCYMTPGANPTLPGRLTDPDAGEHCIVAVARNVVGESSRAAQPIRVCAASDYQDSTQAAIGLLNAYGGWGTLFAWAGVISDPDNPDGSPCKHETGSGWVSSVVVTNDYYTGSATQPSKCRASRGDSPGFACVRHFTVRGNPHYGFIGRAEIRIHPDLDVVTATNYQYGTCAPEGHEQSADYNPATAQVRICSDSSDVQPGRADGTLELTRHVAHELMHIVGLRDYSCEKWPLKATDDTVTRALMDTLFRPACRSPLLANPTSRIAGTGALITSWDEDDYDALYSPATVTGLRVVRATGTELVLGWTAGRVHVEQGFAVERRQAGSNWQRVTVVAANATSATVAKPSVATDYRVASLTSAFGTAAEAYATSGEVSYSPPVVVPAVSVSGGDAVTEGADARFVVTASPRPSGPLEVALAESQSGRFARAALPRTVTVTVPVSGRYTHRVGTLDDRTDEKAGAIVVRVSAGSGYTVGSPSRATVTVRDNDPPYVPPTVTPEPTKTCWNDAVIPVSESCPPEPTKTCWNDAVIPVSETCPPEPTKTCWNDAVIPVSETCPPEPTKTCWNDAVIPVSESCPPEPTVTPEPTKTCWNDAVIPVSETCPPKPPPPPTPTPEPEHECWNGVKVHSPDECEPEPERCFDPFFNEVPCPPPDPCVTDPFFPNCARQEDEPEPEPLPPPEAALPGRPRELAALARGAAGAVRA